MSPQSSPVVTEVRRAQVDGRLRQAAVSLKPPTINGAGAGGGKEEARHVDAAQGVDAFQGIARHQVHKPPETSHLSASTSASVIKNKIIGKKIMPLISPLDHHHE